MAKKKYYAVKNGKEIGIFDTWDKCKSLVHGYPNAEYKSFFTKEEADEYLGNKTNNVKIDEENTIEAYVDGSYEHCIKKYGSGVAIVKNDNIIYTISEPGVDENMLSMRNVAGEIEASRLAMDYCIKNDIKNLILYYDYEGIEKWCSGSWKTNKEGTKAYKAFYDSIADKLNVKFIKVKAHSGDKYNEEADKLAKAALLK